MTRSASLFIAVLTLAACREADPTASRETSPGGIAYTLLHMPAHEDVTIHVAWPTDWAYRPATNKAAPSVGAQLILAGGAEGYPAETVGERFADLGSEGTVHIGVNDHVVGELTFERGALDETIAIANAHVRAPLLEQMWFDRIRDGVAQTLAETEARPVQRGIEAGLWAIFGDAPLRSALSASGSETLDLLTRDDVAAWHAETLTRGPEAIVVAGGIDAEDAGKALDALLGGLPEARPAPPRETQADFRPRRLLMHLPEAQVTHITFVAPLPPTARGGELEDLILIHALGGDDRSALFDAVRTDLRASYGFGAGVANFTRDHRILFLAGEVETEKLADVERVVRDAYAGFRETGPRGALDDLKAPLEAHLEQVPDFVVDQAWSELQSALDGFAPGRSLQLVDELGAVTEDSLRARLAEAHPGPGDFLVIAVSPDADALPGACVIRAPAEAAACP